MPWIIKFNWNGFRWFNEDFQFFLNCHIWTEFLFSQKEFHGEIFIAEYPKIVRRCFSKVVEFFFERFFFNYSLTDDIDGDRVIDRSLCICRDAGVTSLVLSDNPVKVQSSIDVLNMFREFLVLVVLDPFDGRIGRALSFAGDSGVRSELEFFVDRGWWELEFFADNQTCTFRDERLETFGHNLARVIAIVHGISRLEVQRCISVSNRNSVSRWSTGFFQRLAILEPLNMGYRRLHPRVRAREGHRFTLHNF